MDDLTLQLREMFERHAAQVDTSSEAQARVAPTRRHRRWWPAVAAAGVVLAVVVAGAVLGSRAGENQTATTAPTTAPRGSVDTAGWRTESWRGVQVRVPSEWGWGGTPTDDWVGDPGTVSDLLLDCGASAYRTPDGRREVNGSGHTPYVGRPIMMTDACATYDPEDPPQPAADYVWLGAPLERGIVRIGGYTQETVDIAGTTVTVTTDDPALRAAILATARPTEGPCPATVAQAHPQVTGPADGMAVCAYEGGDARGVGDLVYSTWVSSAAVEEFDRAWHEGISTAAVDCFLPHTDEWVVLATQSKNYVVRFDSCPRIVAGNADRLLTRATAAPWAVDGIPVYVVGPSGASDLQRFFRGMLG